MNTQKQSINQTLKEHKSVQRKFNHSQKRVRMLQSLTHRKKKIYRTINDKVQACKYDQQKETQKHKLLQKLNQTWYKNYLSKKSAQTQLQYAKNGLIQAKQLRVENIKNMKKQNRLFIQKLKQQALLKNRLKCLKFQKEAAISSQNRKCISLTKIKRDYVRKYKIQCAEEVQKDISNMKNQLTELSQQENKLIKSFQNSNKKKYQLLKKMEHIQRIPKENLISMFNKGDQ